MLRARMGPTSLPRPLQMQRGLNAVSNHWAIVQAKQRAVLALFVLVMVASLFLSLRAVDSHHGLLAAVWLSDAADVVEPSPTLESRADTEFVWQIPEDARAVLFIAHGCFCKATNFWDQHPQCATCVGLPEDRLLVLEALKRRYAVIVISSKGHKGCWNHKADAGYVKEILSSWIAEHGLQLLPVSALGASSGGFFVSSLARELEFKSLVVMISPGDFDSPNFGQIQSTYPPTLFVHMPKDEVTATKVSKSIQLLRAANIPTDEVRCHEFAISAEFFSNRIPGLSFKLSAKIFNVLKDSGLLNKNGFVKLDGRHSNWQMPIKKWNVLPEEARGRLRWETHIQEELNVAYAKHEMTALESGKIFDWLDNSNSTSLRTTE